MHLTFSTRPSVRLYLSRLRFRHSQRQNFSGDHLRYQYFSSGLPRTILIKELSSVYTALVHARKPAMRQEFGGLCIAS